ncbi:MAG: ATP-binding protein [Clostridia bacterium]|nr:ATP-binding protein [Clostridia bacterium]
MAYSKETIEKAKAELDRRRREAENKAYRTKEEFFRVCPEAEAVQRRIASAGSRAAIAVAKGGDVRANLTELKNENLELQKIFSDLLKAKGLKKEDITPQYSCPKCSDTGYSDGYRCECFKKLLRMSAFEALNKVSPLSISTFDSFDLSYCKDNDGEPIAQMASNLQKCREFARNFRNETTGLLLTGSTGLGKTHLSLAIAGEVINQGYGVVYGSAYGFANTMEKERFSDGGEDIVTVLTDADLLIIDDLGAENITKYTLSTMYNIIDTRIMRKKPTVISTNLVATELDKIYGSRFSSRVFSAYKILKFSGKDVRLAKRRGY